MARLQPQVRKNDIIAHALVCAQKVGYQNVTRSEIAKQANVSDALVSAHFGTMQQVRRSIMRHAVKTECLEVVAQGLSHHDPIAKKAPEDVRQRAVRQMMGA